MRPIVIIGTVQRDQRSFTTSNLNGANYRVIPIFVKIIFNILSLPLLFHVS